MSIVRNPNMIKGTHSQESSYFYLGYTFSFHLLDNIHLVGDGFRSYAPHKCPTINTSGCPNADFSPESVRFASSSLSNTLSQSLPQIFNTQPHPLIHLFLPLKNPWLVCHPKMALLSKECNILVPYSLHLPCVLQSWLHLEVRCTFVPILSGFSLSWCLSCRLLVEIDHSLSRDH